MMQETITAKNIRKDGAAYILIPNEIIEQFGIRETVHLRIVDGALQISPARHPRAGWAEQMAAMAANGDDKLLLPDTMSNKFDDEEWEW